MTIIFGSGIENQYTSLNIKFSVNRLKIPVYRFKYVYWGLTHMERPIHAKFELKIYEEGIKV